MKRIFILLTILMLSGCSFKKDNEDADYLRYKDSLMLIENAPSFLSSSELFSSHLEVTTNNNGYTYYLIIDEPKNAMYNVSLIATIEGVVYDDSTMAPSFGIFGKERVNLVPNQIYKEGGYAKGVVINGNCSKEDFVLKAMVSWTDENNEATYHEYLEIPSITKEVVTDEH